MDSESNNATSSSDQDTLKKLQDRIAEIMESYFKRVEENVTRVENLVALYRALKQDSDFSRDPALDDILRASVVFTHATLEDFLRTLATKLLPMADEETLNQIPLLNINTSGRPEKFLLGNLASFKEKTVEEVIQESVMNFLQRSNFNNIADIVQLLKSLKVDVTKVNRSFSTIEQLMERRHSIVHRADRKWLSGSKTSELMDIDPADLVTWAGA
ncbi:MAG: HEPN domain-containing protein, partial [Anaerolineales bacterium]